MKINDLHRLANAGFFPRDGRPGASLNARILAPLLILAACTTASAAEQTLEYDGFVQPEHDVLVAASDIGRLQTLHVRLGDRVEAGEAIGQMEDAFQRSEVEVARYQAAMEGELMTARADAELYQARAEQLRALTAQRAARPDELLRAETELKLALARVQVAEEAAELRRLQLKRQEAQLEKRTIRAPVAGQVARIYRHPGEYVSPTDPTIVRLVSTESLVAIFNVPAGEALMLKNATRLAVLPRTTGKTVAGAIDAISPVIDGESGTVLVRIKILQSGGRVIAGDRCMLTVSTATPHAARATLAPPPWR